MSALHCMHTSSLLPWPGFQSIWRDNGSCQMFLHILEKSQFSTILDCGFALIYYLLKLTTFSFWEFRNPEENNGTILPDSYICPSFLHQAWNILYTNLISWLISCRRDGEAFKIQEAEVLPHIFVANNARLTFPHQQVGNFSVSHSCNLSRRIPHFSQIAFFHKFSAHGRLCTDCFVIYLRYMWYGVVWCWLDNS